MYAIRSYYEERRQPAVQRDRIAVALLEAQRTRVAADDPRFPWLFGAMGQLGIVLDATLAIVPMRPEASPPYPEGRALVAPLLAPPKIPPEYAAGADESLFWFTLFVPDDRVEA